MRRLILAAVLMSAAGWAMAQEPRPEAQEPQKPAQTVSDAKEMTATVVATDPAVKTITIKKEAAGAASGTASEQVFPVDDKALANLKMTKAGDKVKLTLKSDPATGKETVTSIEKPKSSTQEPR
jgi:Cu/Ag efflux protein CusF